MGFPNGHTHTHVHIALVRFDFADRHRSWSAVHLSGACFPFICLSMSNNLLQLLDFFGTGLCIFNYC